MPGLWNGRILVPPRGAEAHLFVSLMMFACIPRIVAMPIKKKKNKQTLKQTSLKRHSENMVLSCVIKCVFFFEDRIRFLKTHLKEWSLVQSEREIM